MEWSWSTAWNGISLVGWLLLQLLKVVWVPIAWLLKLLLSIFLTIAAPFLYLGHVMLHLCYLPIHFLAKLEVSRDETTLYPRH